MENLVEFHDELFDDEKVKVHKDSCVDYKPKVCTPGWFMKTELPAVIEDYNVKLKFQAEWLHMRGDVKSACEIYKNLFENLQKSNYRNCPIARDVGEGLTRCYLNLGKVKDAMDMTIELYKSFRSTEQQLGILILLSEICNSTNAIQCEILILQWLIQDNVMYWKYWYRLTIAFFKFFNINRKNHFDKLNCITLGTSKISKLTGNLSTSIEFDKYITEALDIKRNTDFIKNLQKLELSYKEKIIAVCIFRAQMLSCIKTKLGPLNTTVEVEYRNELDRLLQDLEISEEFIKISEKFLGIDIGKDTQDGSDFVDLSKTSQKLKEDSLVGRNEDSIQFYNRWFSWITK